MIIKSDFKLKEIPVTTPIFSTILDDHVELNKYLKEIIFEHREKYPRSNSSNVKCWHSAWNTHEINPKFTRFAKRILDISTFLSKEYYNNDRPLWVQDCWAMMYENGDKAVKHDHFPSLFACCYYVDVDTESSPIIFENDYGKSLTIQPKNGMLLIWGAAIKHMVFPTDGRRMAISVNIEIPPVFKEGLSRLELNNTQEIL